MVQCPGQRRQHKSCGARDRGTKPTSRTSSWSPTPPPSSREQFFSANEDCHPAIFQPIIWRVSLTSRKHLQYDMYMYDVLKIRAIWLAEISRNGNPRLQKIKSPPGNGPRSQSMNHFRTDAGPCHSSLHKWGYAASPLCDCGLMKHLHNVVVLFFGFFPCCILVFLYFKVSCSSYVSAPWALLGGFVRFINFHHYYYYYSGKAALVWDSESVLTAKSTAS